MSIERALAVTCLVLCAASFAGCENDIRKVKLVTAQKKLPLQDARELEVLYSDSAMLKVKLTAPVSQRYETPSPYIEFPKGLKALFYEKEQVKSTLTANYAINREKERMMEARGNVIVVNEKGERLNTEHLIWDEAREKIFTKEFVKITTTDKIIFGQGMEANQDFSVYKIFNIKGTINVKNNAPGT